MKKLISGNEAIGLAAVSAGCKVITGYPGTPSSEVIGSLLKGKPIDGRYIGWASNEKVAVEIAAAAAWAGQRALCTMKMSGLNVTYDSLIGVAYSGCRGGLVIYVADDPGVSTGMCEQDSRAFALMTDMVLLDPASVAEAYGLTGQAFELSEAIGSPVFIRCVTNVAQSHAMVDIKEEQAPLQRQAVMLKDIQKFTKAGAAICTAQRTRLIESLAQAESEARQRGLFKLELRGEPGGFGIAACGVAACYIEEALEIASQAGVELPQLSLLRVSALPPFAAEEMQALLRHCGTVLVLEELEGFLEKELILTAYRQGARVAIHGKLDGFFSRLGEYDAATVAAAVCRVFAKPLPVRATDDAVTPAKRPITTCAGCPHRGSFMALNRAVRQAGYRKDEVIVTGDIGCTILGMNPPFDCLWTELSMGASIALAQGFLLAGIDKPVIATIGDSTFFHAGMPALVNAVQLQADLTVLILDNGWTAMTGMQVNPGTAEDYQPAGRRLDLAAVVKGMGIEACYETDPYDLKATTDIIADALGQKGLKVIICRRECAIQAARRKVDYGRMQLLVDKCTNCLNCVKVTGCPALVIKDGRAVLEEAQCNGCGLCGEICAFGALQRSDADE